MEEGSVWLCWWRENAFAWRANPSGGSNLAAVRILLHLHRPRQLIQSDNPAYTYSDIPPTFQICHRQQQISFTTPISNKTPTFPFCFVFNKSAPQHPRTPVAFRKGIYHSALDQIWHVASFSGNSGRGYKHTVDLLAWYTGHTKIKYAPENISHLSCHCPKPILTVRASRIWRGGWPNKENKWTIAFKNWCKDTFSLNTTWCEQIDNKTRYSPKKGRLDIHAPKA